MPAAAVIRKVRALSGFIGFKGMWLNHSRAARTGLLEFTVSGRNSWCSGEMLRYHEEPRLRRQPAAVLLTLMLEGAGIEQD